MHTIVGTLRLPMDRIFLKHAYCVRESVSQVHAKHCCRLFHYDVDIITVCADALPIYFLQIVKKFRFQGIEDCSLRDENYQQPHSEDNTKPEQRKEQT